jgi:hypothetical protein
MKKYLYAVIITCIGTILLGLNIKQEQPVHQEPIETPVAHVEAPQEPIEPEPTLVPEEPLQTITEPVQQPQAVQTYTGDCSLVYNYDWPVGIAYGVCMAESGGNVNAVNWGDNHGKCVGSFSLMQVGCFWYPYFGYSSADFYNPQVNMDIAYKIWQRQGGFGAWSAFTNGSYLRYM